ncbi:MAG: SEC-C domain-containing protein [Vicinamibacteria bacterium]|nr:SEC-C domain-containing protein [Vicinamibacteria bacterium]
MSSSLGRNEPCHCGSGKKYKHCCLVKDEAARRSELSSASSEETPGDSASAASSAPAPPRGGEHAAKPSKKPWQPWRQRDNRIFPHFNLPRRSGGS